MTKKTVLVFLFRFKIASILIVKLNQGQNECNVRL